MKCVWCDVVLAGGLDTMGTIDDPMCMGCFLMYGDVLPEDYVRWEEELVAVEHDIKHGLGNEEELALARSAMLDLMAGRNWSQVDETPETVVNWWVRDE